MRVLVAPQGFKGTLSGQRAAEAIAEGLLRAVPDADVVTSPMADGGHGMLDALLAATDGQRFTARVTGPLGEAVDAGWGALGTLRQERNDQPTAVVEMAQASGLTLVPEGRRNPLDATTYGTGQLIGAALDEGYRRIIVGVGGSATNDGGAGAAQALGVKLLDKGDHDIALGAAGLIELARVDLSTRRPEIADCEVLVATDVSNPLTGPQGAAFTYGPQKGATPEQLLVLDGALSNMASVVERDLGIAIRDVPGMGAAGGLAAGLVAFLGARLEGGAKLIANATGLDALLSDADLAITGEGRIDWQTLYDKAPIEVARRAAARGVPVIGIGGSLGRGADDVLQHGMTLIEACTAEDAPPPTNEAEAYATLANAAERAVRRWLTEA